MTETVIEVFADIVCPFTHVGLQRLVARRHELDRDDVKLLVRALPLEVINGEAMQPGAVADKVELLRQKVSPTLFEGFDPDHFPTTSLPALALTSAAYRQGLTTGETVALRLRQLVFDEGVDVSDPGVLEDLADRYGLRTGANPTTGRSLDDFSEVMADLDESRERGVIGSPHFFTPTGESLFCPTLEVSKADGQLDVSIDVERFEHLIEASFA